MSDHPETKAPPATPGPAQGAAGLGAGVDGVILESKVVDMLRTCYDPEIPVNIHELGLIYEVKVRPGGSVYVKMTLTSPMCPVAGSLPPEVEAKVKSIDGVSEATVEVVWDPPWAPEMMSEAARLQLGLM